jgi:hypothetical protein
MNNIEGLNTSFGMMSIPGDDELMRGEGQALPKVLYTCGGKYLFKHGS